MLLTSMILSATLTASPPTHTSPMGQCDPVKGQGERLVWTAADRRETYDRVEAACKAAKLSPYATAWVMLRTEAESHGNAGVRHTYGFNENGLGPHGLSLRWAADKWPGDPDPDWCQPEASFTVVHAILRRAVFVWDAPDILTVQKLYGGHWKKQVGTDGVKRTRWLDLPDEYGFCERMRERGFSCYRPITKADLGIKVPKHERKTWADERAAAFEAG